MPPFARARARAISPLRKARFGRRSRARKSLRLSFASYDKRQSSVFEKRDISSREYPLANAPHRCDTRAREQPSEKEGGTQDSWIIARQKWIIFRISRSKINCLYRTRQSSNPSCGARPQTQTWKYYKDFKTNTSESSSTYFGTSST